MFRTARAGKLLKFSILVVLQILISSGAQAQNANERSEIYSVAYSPDGRRIAVGGGSRVCPIDNSINAIQIFETASNVLLQSLEGHNCRVLSIDWSPDGNYIVSSSTDGTVRIWDTRTGEEIGGHGGAAGEGERFDGVTWNPAGNAIAVFSGSAVLILDSATASIEQILNNDSLVTAIAWSWNGSKLAAGTENNQIVIWNSSGQQIGIIDNISVRSVAWSPDGEQFAVGSSDGALAIIDIETGQVVNRLVSHTDSVVSVVWNPAGNELASGSFDGTITIWNVTTGEEVSQIATVGIVRSVDWNPDGTQLAYGGSRTDGGENSLTLYAVPSLETSTPTPTNTPIALYNNG